MSRKYKMFDREGMYFISFATINWINVFVRQQYFELICDSLNYCVKHKGMVESTPKSKKTRHCEARSDLIILVICILRLPHFIRNDEKLLFGVDSWLYIVIA